MKIEKAFMVRTHPQWRGALDLISKGSIGTTGSVVRLQVISDQKKVSSIQFGLVRLLRFGLVAIPTAKELAQVRLRSSEGTRALNSGKRLREFYPDKAL